MLIIEKVTFPFNMTTLEIFEMPLCFVFILSNQKKTIEIHPISVFDNVIGIICYSKVKRPFFSRPTLGYLGTEIER